MELCLGTDDEPAGSCWVTLREQTKAGDAVVGVCHRPPDQEEGDEAFFRREEEAIPEKTRLRGFYPCL